MRTTRATRKQLRARIERLLQRSRPVPQPPQERGTAERIARLEWELTERLLREEEIDKEREERERA